MISVCVSLGRMPGEPLEEGRDQETKKTHSSWTSPERQFAARASIPMNELRSTWRRVQNETSLLGVDRLKDEKRPLFRLVWASMVVAAIGIVSVQVEPVTVYHRTFQVPLMFARYLRFELRLNLEVL